MYFIEVYWIYNSPTNHFLAPTFEDLRAITYLLDQYPDAEGYTVLSLEKQRIISTAELSDEGLVITRTKWIQRPNTSEERPGEGT